MIEIQNKLHSFLSNIKFLDPQNTENEDFLIAGFDTQDCDGYIYGGICLFNSQQEVIESLVVKDKPKFEYQAGFLGFRELPVLLKMVKKLKNTPSVYAIDGFGFLHPRKMGFATQASIYLKKPVFGVAKSKYIGKYSDPNHERGSFTNIIVENEILGASVRTKSGINPVFISIGGGISLDLAIKLTLRFAKFRIPEFIRHPDRIVRAECQK